jgi:hypothetical protein
MCKEREGEEVSEQVGYISSQKKLIALAEIETRRGVAAECLIFSCIRHLGKRPSGGECDGLSSSSQWPLSSLY